MRAGASTRCATHDLHANDRQNVVIRSGRRRRAGFSMRAHALCARAQVPSLRGFPVTTERGV